MSLYPPYSAHLRFVAMALLRQQGGCWLRVAAKAAGSCMSWMLMMCPAAPAAPEQPEQASGRARCCCAASGSWQLMLGDNWEAVACSRTKVQT